MNKKLEGSASCAEKVARLHASAMYRGSVSTFADLSVAFGAAPCHVQRVHFWHLKSAYFLETRWGPPLVPPSFTFTEVWSRSGMNLIEFNSSSNNSALQLLSLVQLQDSTKLVLLFGPSGLFHFHLNPTFP